MHEYGQVIRDVDNCLKYLNDGGIIVLHDCNPDSERVATPFNKISGKIRERWMGDVWKAVVYLRAFRTDINIFVLDVECGLGIVTRGEPDNKLMCPIKDVDGLSYCDLEKNRNDMLNLKDVAYFSEFLAKKVGKGA